MKRRKDKWSETMDWLYLRAGPLFIFGLEISISIFLGYAIVLSY